jgi:hypothetical protein
MNTFRIFKPNLETLIGLAVRSSFDFTNLSRLLAIFKNVHRLEFGLNAHADNAQSAKRPELFNRVLSYLGVTLFSVEKIDASVLSVETYLFK